MNDNWTRYGRQRLADAITGGESLADAADQLAKELASPAGNAAYCGFLSASLEVLERLRAGNFKFRGDELLEMSGQAAALHLTGHLVRAEWGAVGTHVGALMAALESCRHRLVAQQPGAPVKAPEPAPLKVQIVGMPERVTSTEIARDAAGNIASSAQIERDAVPHE